MPSICVDCSGLSASVGSIFHQNQLSGWAEAAAAENDSKHATARSRQ